MATGTDDIKYKGMSVLVPLPVTSTVLHSTTASDAATPAWVSGTTYAVGDLRAFASRVYKRTTAGAGTKTPDTDPDNWSDDGPTNSMAMFDDENNTASKAPAGTPLTVVLRTGLFNALYLGGLVGGTATVTVHDGPGGAVLLGPQVHDLGARIVGDWYDYLFAPFKSVTDVVIENIPLSPAAEVTITIDAGSGVAQCAMCAHGDMRAIGGTRWGASAKLVSYSHIKTDAFGKTTRKKRFSAKTMRASVWVEIADAAGVQELLEQLDAVAALWIATPMPHYRPLRVFGLGQGELSFDNPKLALLSLEATGLI